MMVRKSKPQEGSRQTTPKYLSEEDDSRSDDEGEEDDDGIVVEEGIDSVSEYDVSEELMALDRLIKYKPILPPNEALDKDEDEYIDKFDGIPDIDEDIDEDYGPKDEDPRHKLGRLLLSLGKIHYRHAESHSSDFIDRLNEICSYRTKAQIRRCLKDWMLKYDRDDLNKYRLKELKWGHQVPALDKIQQLHAYGPEETAAYAFYYMPSRYSLMKRILSELKLLSPHYQPSRVLDFGCGPGGSGYAVHEVWGDAGATKYTGIDISQSMIDAAKIMTRDTIRDCIFYSSSAEATKRMTADHRYSLAIASYTLSELPNDLSRRVAVQMLFESLEVGGYLVVLEAGNPFGSHTTRTARQFVLDVFNHVDSSGRTTKPSVTSFDTSPTNMIKGKLTSSSSMNHPGLVNMMLPPASGYGYHEVGAYVVSPCTHDQQCPLAPGGWCSFSQKVYSGMIRKASEEKFSYVVIQKRPKVLRAKTEHLTHEIAPNRTQRTVDPRLTDAENDIMEMVGSVLDGAPVKNTRKSTGSTTMTTKSKQQIELELENHAVYSSNAFKKWGIWLESQAYLYQHITDARNPNKIRGVIQDNATSIDPTPLMVLQRFVGTEREDVQHVLDELTDELDWDDYTPPLYREEWGRIIRSPIKSKGHILLDLCVPDGHIVRSSLSRSNMLNVPSLYIALRKTTWGGLFPVLHDQLERSPLSKKERGVFRKTNSNSKKDEMARIENSNSSREYMRDAMWDARSHSVDYNDHDGDDRAEPRSSSRKEGKLTRSRDNNKIVDELEDDNEDQSSSYSQRRRRTSGLSTMLQKMKMKRRAKKET